MDLLKFAPFAILLFFLGMKWLNNRDAENQRRHEFDMLRLRQTQAFIVSPFVINLLHDLEKDERLVAEEKEALVKFLQLLMDNYIADKSNDEQIKDAQRGLFDILGRGNLAADIGIKVKQIVDLIQVYQ